MYTNNYYMIFTYFNSSILKYVFYFYEIFLFNIWYQFKFNENKYFIKCMVNMYKKYTHTYIYIECIYWKLCWMCLLCCFKTTWNYFCSIKCFKKYDMEIYVYMFITTWIDIILFLNIICKQYILFKFWIYW